LAALVDRATAEDSGVDRVTAVALGMGVADLEVELDMAVNSTALDLQRPYFDAITIL
jgi:hypothetical protein